MNNLRTIAVGSTNPIKIAAVRSALDRAGIAASITGITVPSGVPEQPIGAAQVLEGAINRANNARAAANADWGVGLEGGVEFDHTGACWLYNVAVIVSASGTSQARGGALLLPPVVAARIRAGEELGPVMDEVTQIANSKQKLGAIGFLTGGVVLREDAFRDSFGRALAPLLHPELYAPIAILAGVWGP